MDFGQDAGRHGKRERRKPINEAPAPAAAEQAGADGSEAAAPPAPPPAPAASQPDDKAARLAAKAAELANEAAKVAAAEPARHLAQMPSTSSSKRGARGKSDEEGKPSEEEGGSSRADAKKPGREQRRETVEQREAIMERLQPLQQLLMLGFLPEEADLSVWTSYGTVQNGWVEIRESRVERVLGEYAIGRGLFACRDFAMNELITVYGGELITAEEARSP